MTISDAIAVIQTILAIGAFIFAYREFKQWRVELLGSKKIELAIKLGTAAIEVREAFKSARSPFGFKGDRQGLEYKPDSSIEEKLRQEQEYDFDQRLLRIHSVLEKLYYIRWEFSVLFSGKESIEEQVKFYNCKYHDLQIAMINSFKGRETDRDFDTLYSCLDGDIDDFSKAIDDNTNKLLELARKYTR